MLQSISIVMIILEFQHVAGTGDVGIQIVKCAWARARAHAHTHTHTQCKVHHHPNSGRGLLHGSLPQLAWMHAQLEVLELVNLRAWMH